MYAFNSAAIFLPGNPYIESTTVLSDIYSPDFQSGLIVTMGNFLGVSLPSLRDPAILTGAIKYVDGIVDGGDFMLQESEDFRSACGKIRELLSNRKVDIDNIAGEIRELLSNRKVDIDNIAGEILSAEDSKQVFAEAFQLVIDFDNRGASFTTGRLAVVFALISRIITLIKEQPVNDGVDNVVVALDFKYCLAGLVDGHLYEWITAKVGWDPIWKSHATMITRRNRLSERRINVINTFAIL